MSCCLAPGAPSAVGANAVRAAYTGIFQAIDIDLTFEVAEVNVVSGDWAFLRSTSHGTVRILANGAQLARYGFSSALPSAWQAAVSHRRTERV